MPVGLLCRTRNLVIDVRLDANRLCHNGLLSVRSGVGIRLGSIAVARQSNRMATTSRYFLQNDRVHFIILPSGLQRTPVFGGFTGQSMDQKLKVKGTQIRITHIRTYVSGPIITGSWPILIHKKGDNLKPRQHWAEGAALVLGIRVVVLYLFVLSYPIRFDSILF